MRGIVAAAVLIGSAFIPSFASAGETTISCKVYGPGAVGYDYRTVVEGAFKLDLDEIVLLPKHSSGGCIEVGRKSKTFGVVGGTRLEMAAFKCDKDEAYFTAKVQVAGVTVVSHIKRGTSRLTINDDGSAYGKNIVADPTGALPRPEPVVLREGTFRFLYVDCTVE